MAYSLIFDQPKVVFMTLSRTSSNASLEAKPVESLASNDALNPSIPGSFSALASIEVTDSTSPKVSIQTQDLKSPAEPKSPRRVALERLTIEEGAAKTRAEAARAARTEFFSTEPSTVNQSLQSLMDLRLSGQTESASALVDTLIAGIQPVNQPSARTSNIPTQQQNAMRAKTVLNRLAAVKAKAVAMQKQAGFEAPIQTPVPKASAHED